MAGKGGEGGNLTMYLESPDIISYLVSGDFEAVNAIIKMSKIGGTIKGRKASSFDKYFFWQTTLYSSKLCK